MLSTTPNEKRLIKSRGITEIIYRPYTSLPRSERTLGVRKIRVTRGRTLTIEIAPILMNNLPMALALPSHFQRRDNKYKK
jgi:hypothetical protein